MRNANKVLLRLKMSTSEKERGGGGGAGAEKHSEYTPAQRLDTDELKSAIEQAQDFRLPKEACYSLSNSREPAPLSPHPV